MFAFVQQALFEERHFINASIWMNSENQLQGVTLNTIHPARRLKNGKMFGKYGKTILNTSKEKKCISINIENYL